MKKFICLFLALILVFGSITAVADSPAEEKLTVISPFEYQKSVYASRTSDEFEDYSDETIDKVTNMIRTAIRTAETEVVIKQYYITTSALSAIIRNIYYTCAETFLNNGYNIYYYSSGNYVTRVIIEYTVPKATYLKMKTDFFEEIDRIISLMDDNFTDMEKIVFIHDYIVKNYSYDTRLFSPTEYNKTIHDSYNFVFEKVGVCQAYASTFMFFMEQLGINCRVAVSSDHAWNIIELDGKFYHVDCTWDDPLNYENADFYGLVKHNHLLLSDDGIRAADSENQTSHASWVEYPSHYADATCNDKKFENYFWTDVTTPLVPYNNNWYGLLYNKYTNNTSIISCNNNFSQIESVYTMRDRWYVSGNSGAFWVNSFSGLELIGDRLYFNMSKSICLFDLEKNTNTVINTFDINDDNIYSCLYHENGIIRFYTAASPNDAIDNTLTYDVRGDISGDGFITANDLVGFKKALLGFSVLTNSVINDLDVNGKTNIIDYIILKKYIAGNRENLN